MGSSGADDAGAGREGIGAGADLSGVRDDWLLCSKGSVGSSGAGDACGGICAGACCFGILLLRGIFLERLAGGAGAWAARGSL